jgi:hypothetical protein
MKNYNFFFKRKKKQQIQKIIRAGRVAQMVERLPYTCEVLSSNSRTAPEKSSDPFTKHHRI